MAHAAYVKRSSRKHTPPMDAENAEGTGFWTKSGVNSRYFVRPCRKRFDLYQLSATPTAQQWHHETLQSIEVAAITVTRRERDSS